MKLKLSINQSKIKVSWNLVRWVKLFYGAFSAYLLGRLVRRFVSCVRVIWIQIGGA